MSVSAASLVAGRDYPRTLAEFSSWFPDEAACLLYLSRVRWPEGFRCRRCGGTHAWWLTRGLWRCASCRLESSVTAGTVLADTRLPLTTWLAATWYVTNQKSGVSALSLQRALGLARYETAWTLLHKLRRAMVRPGRDRLAGEIEVDETFVGPQAPGTHGRGGKKQIVAIAVEMRPKGACGRVRLARIGDCSEPSLTEFVSAAAECGCVIYTDSWRGYDGVAGAGFVHHATSIAASGDPAHIVMPRVHRVASLLKRWLLGTHQGAVRTNQLDYYLDEFTFRFNRRGSRQRGLLFRRLLEQAVTIDHVPASQIIGGRQLAPPDRKGS